MKKLSAGIVAGIYVLLTLPALSERNGPPVDAGLTASVPDGADIRILADYGVKYRRKWFNKSAKRWSPTHHNGLDFVRVRSQDVDSKVISATLGTVVETGHNKCAAGYVIVRTPFKVRRNNKGKKRTVFALYTHLAKIQVKKGSNLKHGTPIGRISKTSKRFPCIGQRPHLHFELSHSRDFSGKSINPNLYWANEPGEITCYKKGSKIATSHLALTSPLTCGFDEAKRNLAKRFQKPEFDGTIHELGSYLETADAEYIKKWQAYFKLFGHYSGAVDGVYGKNTHIAATRCAWDTKCSR